MKLPLRTLLGLLLLITCVTGAQASTVSFGDPATIWTGFRHSPEMPNTDQNGVPNLTGGTFTYTGHMLSSITLNYTDIYHGNSNWTNTWNSLSAGDWYFDVNRDNTWDYVIHKMANSSSYHLYQASNYWGYGSNTQYDGSGTNAHFTQYNATYTSTDARDWHPTTIIDTGLPYQVYNNAKGIWETQYYNNVTTSIKDLGVVSYDGWDKVSALDGNGNGSSIWDLSKTLNGGIDLSAFMGKDINFAFTMTCANDVLFDESRVPTPEPGTMILMGMGALGAALARRRARRIS